MAAPGFPGLACCRACWAAPAKAGGRGSRSAAGTLAWSASAMTRVLRSGCTMNLRGVYDSRRLCSTVTQITLGVTVLAVQGSSRVSFLLELHAARGRLVRRQALLPSLQSTLQD